jgi:hypothetical protein
MLKKPHSLSKQASCLGSVVEIIDKYGLSNILKTVVISQDQMISLGDLFKSQHRTVVKGKVCIT